MMKFIRHEDRNMTSGKQYNIRSKG